MTWWIWIIVGLTIYYIAYAIAEELGLPKAARTGWQFLRWLLWLIL